MIQFTLPKQRTTQFLYSVSYLFGFISTLFMSLIWAIVCMQQQLQPFPLWQLANLCVGVGVVIRPLCGGGGGGSSYVYTHLYSSSRSSIITKDFI